MSNKKLQKILDETAKIGGHTTEVNEGYQEIKEKMTDNLSTGNVPVADLNKASKLMTKAHKLAKKLPDAPQRKSSPINHCSSDMMHSQSWNQMRKRNKSALNMLGVPSPLNKISGPCKTAAKKKFKVWPSAYASGWGVRCTKAGGPSKFGNKSKK